MSNIKSELDTESGEKHTKNAPWYNEECRLADRAKRNAKLKLRRHPSNETCLVYKNARNNYKKVLRKVKARYKQEICQHLG